MQKAGTAYIDILPDFKGFNQQVDAELAPMAGKFGKFGKAAALGIGGLTVAAGAAGLALFKVGESFDGAYDAIRVGTGKTGKVLDGLKADFRNVVKSVPADFGQAAQAVSLLNQRLGISGTPLRNMSKQVLELSRITKTDLGENIEAVTRVFGDWSIKTREQGPALDLLFRASQRTGVPVAKLGEMIVKYGAPLRQLGFSFAESAAMVGKFEKEGVNTQLVMGSMRIALGKLARAGKDPQEEFGRVTEAIKQTGSVSDANRMAVELFGARAGPDMAAAIREGRLELGTLTRQIAGGKETILGAAKDTQDFSEKWQLFKNRVLLLLEPIAVKVFDAVGKAMDLIGPASERVFAAFRSVKAAFKGGGEQGERLRGVVDTVKGAFRDFGTIVKAAVDIATAVWARFGAIFEGQVGTALRTFLGFASGLLKAMGGVVEVIAGILTGDWSRAWDGIKQIFSGAWQAMASLIRGVFETIVNIIRTGASAIGAILSGAWDLVKIAAGAAWDAIKAVAGAAWTAIKWAIVNPAIAAYEFIRNTIFVPLTSWLSARWQTIRAFASAAWNAIRKVIIDPLIAGYEFIRNTIFVPLTAWLGARWQTIRSFAATAWNAIKRVIIEPLVDGYEFIRNSIFVAMTSWLSDRWQTIRGFAAAAWSGIKKVIIEPLVDGYEFIRNSIFVPLTKWLGDRWDTIRDGVVGFGKGVKDAVVGAFKGAANAVIDFVNAIIGAINKIPGVNIGKIGKLKHESGDVEALAAGGKVTKMMALVGEEAPRHPEYVIPTNPAYRDRALGLVAGLLGDLGIKGYAEGGVIGRAAGALGLPGGLDVVLSLLDNGPKAILDALPGTGGLPGWLKGMGSSVLAAAAAWIKEQVKELLSSSKLGSVLGGISTNVKAAILARKFGLSITSGYRSPEHNRAVGGVEGSSHTRGSPSNPGAHDFVPPNQAAGSFATGSLGAIWSDIHDFGSGLHLHVSWFKKGGVIGQAITDAVTAGMPPFAGSYAAGGVVPRSGMAMVHAGETVHPPGWAPEVRVFIGDRELTDIVRVEVGEQDRRKAGVMRAGVLSA